MPSSQMVDKVEERIPVPEAFRTAMLDKRAKMEETSARGSCLRIARILFPADPRGSIDPSIVAA